MERPGTVLLDKRSKLVAWPYDVAARTRSSRLPKYYTPTSLAPLSPPRSCARCVSTNNLGLVPTAQVPLRTTGHAIGRAAVEGLLFSVFLIGPPRHGAVVGLSRAPSMRLKPVRTLRDVTGEQRPLDVTGAYSPWHRRYGVDAIDPGIFNTLANDVILSILRGAALSTPVTASPVGPGHCGQTQSRSSPWLRSSVRVVSKLGRLLTGLGGVTIPALKAGTLAIVFWVAGQRQEKMVGGYRGAHGH